MAKKIASIDNASRLAFAQESAKAFAQADLLGSDAQARIKDALAGATFELWEAVRNAWQGVYRTERECDDGASQKAWSRLIAATGLEKPKSTSASSTKNAAAVAAKQAAQNALKVKTVEGLNVMKQDLAAKAAQGDAAAFKQISMINAEVKRRADEEGKAAKDHLKSVRDRVLEMVRKCEDVETLARLEALLAAGAQAGTPAVVAAPVKTAQKRKAA